MLNRNRTYSDECRNPKTVINRKVEFVDNLTNAEPSTKISGIEPTENIKNVKRESVEDYKIMEKNLKLDD